jgi:hypothetical protein
LGWANALVSKLVVIRSTASAMASTPMANVAPLHSATLFSGTGRRRASAARSNAANTDAASTPRPLKITARVTAVVAASRALASARSRTSRSPAAARSSAWRSTPRGSTRTVSGPLNALARMPQSASGT